MTYRIYMDVDGVLNVLGQPRNEAQFRHADATPLYNGYGQPIIGGGWSSGDGGKYPMRWDPFVIRELNKLPVELVWLTTWRQSAEDVLKELFGITLPSRVLHPLDGRTDFPSIYWKADALEAEQELDPSDFAWCDDEHWVDPRQTEVRGEQYAPRGILIGPDPGYGLSFDHIDQIRAHINL